MSRRLPRYFWFKASLGLGGLLGAVLLVQALANYHFVSGRLVNEQLSREAVRQVGFLEQQARQARVRDPAELKPFLDQTRDEQKQKIAWIRVLDGAGSVLVQSGEPSRVFFSSENLRSLVRDREPLSRIQDTPEGRVMVTALPFRSPLGPPPELPSQPVRRRDQIAPGEIAARLKFVEIALYTDAASGAFLPLRRNLIVSCSAAVALVAAMIVMGLRLGPYVRGRQLEQQLALAREVQQELLPLGGTSVKDLDIAGACIPAEAVGGDLYDIFPAGEQRVALLLGDVSGKGLSAALLMGLVHGALRSSGWFQTREEHESFCRRLNELLCVRTSGERFTSLFSCYYDIDAGRLYYLNAGHLPPLLFSSSGPEHTIQRLPDGGPVLGLLPEAKYSQGSESFRPGDLLLLYSDGIVEATNSAGEEFGEDRLCAVTTAHRDAPAGEIHREILNQVRLFLGQASPHDDLTLLVVRA